MLVPRWFIPSLICLASSTFAVDASASIQLTKSFGFAAEDAVRAIEVSTLGKSVANSSQASSNQRTPSTPLPLLSMIQQLRVIAVVTMQGSGNSSSATSGRASSSGSGTGVHVIASASELPFDDALVGCLNQSKWLDISMVAGPSLLRPPQAV